MRAEQPLVQQSRAREQSTRPAMIVPTDFCVLHSSPAHTLSLPRSREVPRLTHSSLLRLIEVAFSLPLSLLRTHRCVAARLCWYGERSTTVVVGAIQVTCAILAALPGYSIARSARRNSVCLCCERGVEVFRAKVRGSPRPTAVSVSLVRFARSAWCVFGTCSPLAGWLAGPGWLAGLPLRRSSRATVK